MVAQVSADLPSPPQDIAAGWAALPAPTEQRARRLIGLGDIEAPQLSEELATVRPPTSEAQQAWAELMEVVLAQR